MASNIDVKITADVSDLTAKTAVAKANSNALEAELRKLARAAVEAGGELSQEMKSGLDKAAEAAARAKAEYTNLNNELKNGKEGSRVFTEGLGLMKEGLAALGIVASIEAVKSFGEAVLENAAHLAHEAAVLQLNVEAYQAFRQAAVDTDVGLETADGAIRRFTVNVGNAQAGMGEAGKAFLQMGINVNQSNEALLQQVAIFMQHADAGTRARISQELFGRSGAELIPLYAEWAKGAEELTGHYQKLGRVLSPEVAEAAENADDKLKGAWEHMKVQAAPAVVDVTEKFAGLVEWLTTTNSKLDEFVHKFDIKIDTSSFFGGIAMKLPGSRPAPPEGGQEADKHKLYHLPTEEDEVNQLSALDGKLKQRHDLELAITAAIQKKHEYEAAGHAKSAAAAQTAIDDLQKEMASLNKKPADPTDKLLERQQKEAFRELQEEARKYLQQKDEIARADAQLQIGLARTHLTEEKSILAQEFAEHKISADQKYEMTLQAIARQVDAEKAAAQQIIDSYVTTDTQKHQAMNNMVLLDAQKNAQIAEAARELTGELKREDEKRLESNRATLQQIDTLERGLVDSVFNVNETFTQQMAQLGLRLLQQEIENDLAYMVQHMEVNAGLLASDKATQSAGFLAKLLGLGQQTAAVAAATATQTATTAAGQATQTGAVVASQAAQTGAVAAGTAAQTATKATGAIAGKALSKSVAATEIHSDAYQAAAGAYKSVVGIPYIGPILAPIAAGVAFAAVEAFGSFDKGINVVPGDMIAQIHAGERIVPAADNRAMIAALQGADRSEGGSGGDANLTFAPVINYHKPADLNSLLREQGSDLRAWFAEEKRNGNI